MTSTAQRPLSLPEDDAQAVVLVQAVEEADRAGRLLPLAERRAATREARAEASAAGEAVWLAARARRLVARLADEHRFLPRFLRFTSPVRGLLPPAVVLAFVLGLATNALGPAQRVNVLAVPLLGLIAWNLAVLGLTAVRAWLPLPASLRAGAPRLVDWLEAMARRLIDRLPRRSSGEEEHDELKRALGRYLASWLRAVAPLAASRGRRLLHTSSLALIAGVVAGMYLRGVAVEYRATWESTFLSGAVVDRWLTTLLAPAAAVLGASVPSAAAIESPAHGHGGAWIHLWAVTAALFVGLPRLLLAAFESLRCARRRRRVAISLPDAYVRRLLASVDMSQRRLEVMPYSYHPSSLAVQTLKQILFDLFGPRSEIRLRPALEYGFESQDLEPGDSRLRLVLFGLAQTPEAEVHGELLRHLRDDLPDGQALLVVVDGSSYRQHIQGSGRAPERLAERRRAWDRVARDAGLAALHLDLEEPQDDAVLTHAAAAAWPPGALAVEG